MNKNDYVIFAAILKTEPVGNINKWSETLNRLIDKYGHLMSRINCSEIRGKYLSYDLNEWAYSLFLEGKIEELGNNFKVNEKGLIALEEILKDARPELIKSLKEDLRD